MTLLLRYIARTHLFDRTHLHLASMSAALMEAPAASAARPQIAAASKVPLQACRQQPAMELDVTTWDKQDIMERDQENCSCLHALMQRVYTGMQQPYLTAMFSHTQ